jgi:hypothetical protein
MHALNSRHRTCNQNPLGVWCHASMRFPTPAMAADLVARGSRVLTDPRGAVQRARACVQRERYAKRLGKRGDAPVAYPCAVLKMAFHAQIGRACDLVGDLVPRLVALITGRERELRAFLDIEDDRNGELRAVRPPDIGIVVGVASKISRHGGATPSARHDTRPEPHPVPCI